MSTSPSSPLLSNPSPPPSPDPDRAAHAPLLTILSLSDESTCATIEPPHPQPEITPANTLAHRPTSGPPPSPVPISGLESAVARYLNFQELSIDDLPTAVPLLHVAGLRPQPNLRKRVAAFGKYARGVGMAMADVPREGDFRQRRNWVRVLCAVVFVVKREDVEGWERCREGFEMVEGGWEKCAKNEIWEGDGVIGRLVGMHGGGFSVGVVGTQGGGKSAFVGRVLGRRGLPESHALVYWGKEGEEERMMKGIMAVSYPFEPVRYNMPEAGVEVERCFLKIEGGAVEFLELPSMETDLEYVDAVGCEMESQFGTFERVLEDIQGEFMDYIVCVERLDDVDAERLRKVLGRICRLWGRGVLGRMMVVLTHGQALPPAGMSYAVWVFDRMRVVKEVLERMGGDDIGVVVVENSDNCRSVGRMLVLPDGSDFMSELEREFGRLVQRAKRAPAISAIPTKRWWENYVILFGVAFLIMRLQ